MRIPILTFGAIASILTINSVMADTTVTSKTYVDTTRQATIPAAGTNASTPGTTVVTYTGTAGTIGERGICNDPDEDDCNDGDLVTNSLLNSTMDWVEGELESATNLPTKTITTRVCIRWIDGQSHTDANCLLWDLVDATVYGPQCTQNSDCICPCGGSATCSSGRCDYLFCNGCL